MVPNEGNPRLVPTALPDGIHASARLVDAQLDLDLVCSEATWTPRAPCRTFCGAAANIVLLGETKSSGHTGAMLELQRCLGGCLVSTGPHVDARKQGFQAEYCTETGKSVLFISTGFNVVADGCELKWSRACCAVLLLTWFNNLNPGW